MKNWILALLSAAAVLPSGASEPPKPWEAPDLKPLALYAYGVRMATATDETHIRVVVGCSCTPAADFADSWRIISEDDPAYEYAKFVRPTEAKNLSKGGAPEFELPQDHGLPKGGDRTKLYRTVVELTLPSSLKAGANYSVVAQGREGLMITAANTAASFHIEKPAAATSASSTPITNPPIIAPGIDPIPPRTAATKAFIPSIEPIVGLACGYAQR